MSSGSPEQGGTQGATVELSPHEHKEAERRTQLRAAVVFESIRREGETELQRPVVALAFSGLASGFSMGLSLVASGLLRAMLPASSWRPLIENLGYTLGFLVTTLGRQQLFTENTVTAILPLLDDPNKGQKLLRVFRLWSVVLAANWLGAMLFAFAVAHSGAFSAEANRAFLELGKATLSFDFWTVLVKGIFAGWLIALMVWLLPSAENNRVSIIMLITYVVGLGSLSHVIAGSVDAFYAVFGGVATWAHCWRDFLLPVFLGNSIGGVLLVSLLNYAQVAVKNDEEAA